jgi:hypothetical protein
MPGRPPVGRTPHCPPTPPMPTCPSSACPGQRPRNRPVQDQVMTEAADPSDSRRQVAGEQQRVERRQRPGGGVPIDRRHLRLAPFGGVDQPLVHSAAKRSGAQTARPAS